MTKAKRAQRPGNAAPAGRAPALKKRASTTDAFVQLQQTLLAKARVLQLLTRERERLEERQSFLYSTIAQQEGIVACLGRLLSQQMIHDLLHELQATNTPDHPALVAILHDARAHQLMLEAGGGSGGSGSLPQPPAAPQPLYTNQLMTAMDPARVAQLQAMDVRAQLVPLMRDLTMRISYLLQHSAVAEPGAGSLSESLAQKMDEYSETILVLHTAADDKLLALGLLNFDTCEEQLPAPGHWEAMTDRLGLSEAQAEQIAQSFHLYASRRAVLIAQMHALVAQLESLLSANAPQRCEPDEPTSASLTGSSTNLAEDACMRTVSGCSSHSSLDGESSLAVAGGLRLAQAEQMQQLLEQLDSINGAIREVDRLVVYSTSNVLDKRQLACCVVYSYPWLCQPCAWAEVVFRRSKLAEQLEQEPELA